MSGKTIAINQLQETAVALNQVLRYAFGATIIMLVAMSLNYTLAYLTPVLALTFLAPGAKPPTIKTTLLFLMIIAVTSATGIIFSRFFLEYPLVFMPLLILTIFHIYYTTSLQHMKIWFIISLLVIPMISLQSAQLGSVIALNLFLNALLAITLVWVVYFIFPVKELFRDIKKTEAVVVPSARIRFISAGKKMLVIMPVLILFFLFNWTNALLVLIFVSILSMNPAFANKKAGMALIAANLGGGLVAIVAYNLLTVVPNLIFLGLLTLLAGLIFGEKLFNGKPLSALFGTAFSTFLLILGNVTSFIGEAGEMVWTRILQLAIVVVYLVTGFFLADHFITADKPELIQKDAE
jgi:hypothetical protein